MPARILSTRKLYYRRKTFPSLIRQMRLLIRLCRWALRSEPGKPSEGNDGQGAR